jgi:hypothetical protein
LAVKKKMLLPTALISVLLISVVTGQVEYKHIPPPSDAAPPAITVFSPKNNTIHAENNVTLTIKVTIPELYNEAISDVHYTADWMDGDTPRHLTTKGTQEFSRTRDFTEIPDGNHNLTVYAYASGSYWVGFTAYYFDIGNSSSILFTIDTTAPSINLLSLENKTYDTPDITLNFTVNEPVSKITYSLDGQENVRIDGNTTLTGLSNGYHNLTIYATDEAGNIGTSETITFSIAEETEPPFPTAPVAAASAVIVALVGIGLLVYFKKRKGRRL